jgi:ribonuclease P protein component
VIREGKRVRAEQLDARVLASPHGYSRVGVITPKHQRSAVDRNRLKRRLREMVRLHLLPALRAPVSVSVDVAIRAQRGAYDLPPERLAQGVVSLTSDIVRAFMS